MAKTKKSYAQLRRALDEALAWFDGDNLDVDQAINKYEEAMLLAKELEIYLDNAENRIKQISATAGE